MNTNDPEYAVHKAHCFRLVQPENEFMGCKYGLDKNCPMYKQKTITVKEMIIMLSKFDDNQIIVVSNDEELNTLYTDFRIDGLEVEKNDANPTDDMVVIYGLHGGEYEE